jgi:MFS family permease
MTAHNEHHLFLDLLKNPLSKIYVLQATLTFVKSLIGIFIPVYMYSLGYSLSIIGVYLAIISFIALLLIPFATRMILKIGYKYTILLSLPIYIVHIFLINYIQNSLWIVLLAAFSFGLYVALFWPAYHLELSSQGSSKHRGAEIGTLQVIITLVSSISPFIGGVFLDYLSYNELLIFSLCILCVGFIPFLFAQDPPIKKFSLNFSDYKKIFSKYPGSDKTGFFSEGAEFVVSAYFWPIIIFVLLGNSFIKLGLIFTVAALISVVFITFFKSYVDSHSKKKVLGIITKVMSFNWFLRGIMLAIFLPILYLSESIQRVIVSIYHLSFSSLFYNNAKSSKDEFMYVMAHEIIVHISRVIVSLLIAIIAIFVTQIHLLFLIIVLLGMLIPFGLAKYQEIVS